jgi:hypothetical protein
VDFGGLLPLIHIKNSPLVNKTSEASPP